MRIVPCACHLPGIPQNASPFFQVSLLSSLHPTNCAATHASRRHLSLLVLHDESESVAGDGHDAEGRHEDREVLARLHELAQVLGVLSREERERETLFSCLR